MLVRNRALIAPVSPQKISTRALFYAGLSMMLDKGERGKRGGSWVSLLGEKHRRGSIAAAFSSSNAGSLPRKSIAGMTPPTGKRGLRSWYRAN